MTLANDSILVTPGTGATVATHLPSGSSKEYQAFTQVTEDGHLAGTIPSYLYATPNTAVGASKAYFDFFNASGSGKRVTVRGLWIIPKLDVAVTGAVAIRIDLIRTSAVGTGGTAASYKSATVDVGGGNINPMNTDTAMCPNLPAQITARFLPTGGATVAAWLFASYSLGEESPTSLAYLTQYANLLPMIGAFPQQGITLREGEGLLVRQGTVVSAGSTGFLMAFTVEP